MNTYECWWSKKNKHVQVDAQTTYEAQQKAAALMGCKKTYEVDVYLIAKNGVEVVHIADL